MKARTKMKTLLLLGVLLFGFTVSAQSQKVSLDFKNERVEKVLASIKSQTGMSLVFSDQLVDVNRKVTMQLKDVTLKEALTRLLSGTDLTFEIRNNKIYFIEKKAVSRPGSKKKRVTVNKRHSSMLMRISTSMPNACLRGIRIGKALCSRKVINRIITCLLVLATKIPVLSVLWDIPSRRVFP